MCDTCTCREERKPDGGCMHCTGYCVCDQLADLCIRCEKPLDEPGDFCSIECYHAEYDEVIAAEQARYPLP